MNGKPIRVLHVIGIMNRGGAETMIMNLYRKIDRTKIQFDFVENSFEKADFDDEILKLGGKIYRCPHYNGKNHFQYKNWWKKFFENNTQYKIVHGHIGSTASIYLKIAKKYGLFTIAHSHSAGSDHSFMHLLYCLLSYNTRNIADYFFACSKVAGIDRYGKKIVNSNRFMVLNNAIDSNLFSFNKELRSKVRNELNLKNKMVIGHIGRFTKEKNHIFLLNIFKNIYNQNKDAVLLLVGDGPLREKIEKLASDYGVKDNVIFTGVREDVNRLIQAMDVFVFPSVYEGLGIVLIEAQTSGLPCVISDKVPSESVMVKELVSSCKLTDSLDDWKYKIMSSLNIKRESRNNDIIKHGYDIAYTVKTLENFYLNQY